MHEYQGKKKLGKSLVVNPGYAHNGKAAIIDWPSLKVKFVR
jgi:Icc-related predicted phosphoesterase